MTEAEAKHFHLMELSPPPLRASSAWDLASWDDEEILTNRHSWGIRASDSKLQILDGSLHLPYSAIFITREEAGCLTECSPNCLFGTLIMGQVTLILNKRDIHATI